MSCAARDIYGLACPDCGRSDNLVIAKTVYVRLNKKGRGAIQASFWDEQSTCICDNCKEQGPVLMFIADTAKWNTRHVSNRP